MTEEEKTDAADAPAADLDTTPASGFQPAAASTPQNSSFAPPAASTPNKQDSSFAPGAASTPKKNIRFMDESISKIHVFPTLPATPDSRNKKANNYVTALPIIPDEPQPYNPILYTFRVPDRWPKSLSFLRVRAPPFYLQLDHTIAVIWCLFCPSAKKNLGIAQLQWALSFLRSIYNKNYERPKDIQHCIEAMYDYILELYADISNKLDCLKNMEKSQREEEEAPVETEIPFSLNYSDLLPKFESLTESDLSGGQLVNIDDVYRKEVEGLKDITGTDSVELMTSKSREAAIDYLNETRSKHLKNIVKEVERVKSLENLLSVIATDMEILQQTNTESFIMSILRSNNDMSSDIDNSSDLNNTTNN